MAKQEFFYADNIEKLKNYPDNSLDSIVTDAPYGLSKEPNVIEMLGSWVKNGYMEIKGTGFMGKKWDAFVPQPIFWKEVIRVLKPGGHVLCFFGTRTYDWGVMAMRIAGFEIRDQIQWIYGSGFPKSLNISKSIDKTAGIEQEVIGKRQHPTLKDKSKIDRQGRMQYHGSNPIADEWDITVPASEDAQKWEGWGTALKPANEPIVLARKPIETGLTIADNILKWGTGGINIDATRIPFTTSADKSSATFGRGTNIIGGNYIGTTHSDGRINIEANDNGRFPANIIFDEDAAKILDEQTGELKSGAMNKEYQYTNTGNSLGAPSGKTKSLHAANSGGASRFFYVAKASRSERNKGLEDLPKHMLNWSSGTKNPGSFQSENTERNVQNFHPTVKPIKLMQYLVRMITPMGGICVDPFSGSGTTGIACKLENIDFVGIECDETYVNISNQRIIAWEPEKAIKNNQLEMF